MILLNDPATLPEALDCLSVADVFVAGESDFSRAAASLSDHIKVSFFCCTAFNCFFYSTYDSVTRGSFL